MSQETEKSTDGANPPVAAPEAAATTTESPKAEPTGPSFAELQRKEKALRIRENKLKQEMDSARASWVSDLKSNPHAKLQEYGVSTDQLVDQFLGNTPPPEDMTTKELRELKAWRASQEQEKTQKVLADYQNDVLSHVKKDPIKYELVNEHRDGKDMFWQEVVAYHREYGESPDAAALSEIADKVEEKLYEQGSKLLKLNKFKPKDLENVAKTLEAEEKIDTAKSPSPKTKTISSSLTASSAPAVKRTVVTGDYTPSHSTAFNSYMADKRAAALKATPTKSKG